MKSHEASTIMKQSIRNFQEAFQSKKKKKEFKKGKEMNLGK